MYALLACNALFFRALSLCEYVLVDYCASADFPFETKLWDTS